MKVMKDKAIDALAIAQQRFLPSCSGDNGNPLHSQWWGVGQVVLNLSEDSQDRHFHGLASQVLKGCVRPVFNNYGFKPLWHLR